MKRVFLIGIVLFFVKNSFSFTAGDCEYKNLVLGYVEEGYSYSGDAPGVNPIQPANLTAQRLWPASIA